MKLLLAIRLLSVIVAGASFAFALFGVPIPRIARVGPIALFGAAAAQLTIDLGNARAGHAPWSRALFALIGCAASFEFVRSGRTPLVLLIALALVESSVIGFVLFSVFRYRSARTDVDMPEDILERSYARFAPQAFARFFAAETMIVISSLRYLCGGFRTARPSGFSYHDQSMYTPFLLAMPLFMIPELVAIDLMLWHAAPGWRLASLVIHVYALVWAYGLVALFRNRPHQIVGDRVVFRCGPFRRVVIPRAAIAACTTVPQTIGKSAFKKLAGGDPCLVLLGSPIVCVELREHVGSINRLFVSADDPSALMRVLTA
jgi:hypothetical protein